MKKLYTLLFVALASMSASAQIVISQVYGAGGNNGALFNRDYVELFNRGTSAVTMTGWSVQYNSAAGTNAWNMNAIPDGTTIQPGKYYLIAFGVAGANGVALPAADFDSTTSPLTLSGTTGKLILSNTATAYPAGGCPTATSTIVDVVAFGPTATCFEGNGPAPIISGSLAAFRNNGGCSDTNDNAANFTADAPAPRNSATAANICSTASVGENTIAGLKVYPNPVTNGTLYISTDANSEKAVAIFDVLGKQVVKTTATESVNVSNLKGGVYIVKITEEGKTATRKLVIK